MSDYRPVSLNIPPVVKNLIIINVIMLFVTWVMGMGGVKLASILGLHFILSPGFEPYQLVTHMFMHGGVMHLFFNMFALYMFGRVLESVWGPKRFFIYYFVTGLGAAVLHMAVLYLDYLNVTSQMNADQIAIVKDQGYEIFSQGKNYTDELMGKLNLLMNIPTVGASGAVFGVLLGFGMLFPNTQLMLLFPPIPIKAKYFVIGYGVLELYLGISQSGSNIAHFAHLGGMLFGFLLIRYWNKHGSSFY